MRRRRLTPVQRVQARIVTGPVAHGWAGVADWAVLLTRYLWARVRGRPVL